MLDELATYFVISLILVFIAFGFVYLVDTFYRHILKSEEPLTKRSLITLIVIGLIALVVALFLMAWVILSIKTGAPAKII